MKLELHKNRERKLTDLAREKVNGQNPNMKNVHQNENEYLISLCTVIKKHRANTLLSGNIRPGWWRFSRCLRLYHIFVCLAIDPDRRLGLEGSSSGPPQATAAPAGVKHYAPNAVASPSDRSFQAP